MSCVYVLHHEHQIDPDTEDVKLIGVYSTYENAQEAFRRLCAQPGFCDTQDGFSIDKYEIDKDHWVEGFFTYQY